MIRFADTKEIINNTELDFKIAEAAAFHYGRVVEVVNIVPHLFDVCRCGHNAGDHQWPKDGYENCCFCECKQYTFFKLAD